MPASQIFGPRDLQHLRLWISSGAPFSAKRTVGPQRCQAFNVACAFCDAAGVLKLALTMFGGFVCFVAPYFLQLLVLLLVRLYCGYLSPCVGFPLSCLFVKPPKDKSHSG